jgi:hypothetical protein
MFIIALVIFFSGKILTDSNTTFQTTLNSTQARQQMQDNTDRFTGVFDNVFITISILLLMVVIVNLFFIQTHPALLIFLVIIFCISLIPVAIMGNAFHDITTNTEISSYSSGFSFTNWVMSNIVMVILGFGMIAIIVLYAKFNSD